ncbi:MAG: hypothetical protein IJQ29_05445 [Synergistaceae bacterium]|nr:hypothetical protein [Synergistaceae bacterium]
MIVAVPSDSAFIVIVPLFSEAVAIVSSLDVNETAPSEFVVKFTVSVTTTVIFTLSLLRLNVGASKLSYFIRSASFFN